MTTPIFNAKKAVEATLFVANRVENKDFHKIVKILYFADRDHLAAYGRVITGDTYIKMENGPVPTRIYDGLKALRCENATGLLSGVSTIGSDKYHIKPLRDYNPRLISPSDVEKLSEAIARYGGLSFNQLTQISHAYAWNAAIDDKPIALEDIMREAGIDDEGYIAHITENINASKAMAGYGAN
ncbi:MAG: SocA family protein [Prevotellaceae bacterium]|jgi:uncharacterized phage-associated protein|nr:SocA family protein [Prevotellaceae bacterium]